MDLSIRCCVVLLAGLLATAAVATPAVAPVTRQDPLAVPPPFDEWLQALIREARDRGYPEKLVQDTLAGMEPLQRVIRNDRSQAELAVGFERYFASRVTRAIVRRGRALATRHRSLLRRIQSEHEVQPRFLLAIWGIETRFGGNMGRTPIFQALATLAWEPRRSDFFRDELFDALTIASKGYIKPSQMKGSWAGAMGHPQFMPSSYLKHAVDFDRDGQRDIWTSTGDALASIANYLKSYDWTDDETWGREVKVSPAVRERIATTVDRRTEGCYAMRNMTEHMPLRRWQELGVTNIAGKALPAADVDAALVETDSRAFLVYRNYDALLRYNCAHYYALTVALLSDRLR